MLDLFGPPNSFNGNSRPVVIDTTIDGGNVDYWYQEAQRLMRERSALIEVNDINFRNGLEFKASDAALRAVIRVLLAELKKRDPRSPSLQKNIRDQWYQEYRTAAMDELLKVKKEKAWALRNANHAATPDIVDNLSTIVK